MSLNKGVSTAASIEEQTPSEPVSRLYVFEPGWSVNIKRGSHREFCYMMAPGQDYYHRLLDGELFLHHGDERLCLNCASRRGIISFESRRLRNPIDPALADCAELPVFDPDGGELSFP